MILEALKTLWEISNGMGADQSNQENFQKLGQGMQQLGQAVQQSHNHLANGQEHITVILGLGLGAVCLLQFVKIFQLSSLHSKIDEMRRFAAYDATHRS